MNNTIIRIADWHDSIDREILRAIRQRVFIEEQHVPVELEWDDFDDLSTHFIAIINNTEVATARLKPDGQLGRMAVLHEFRHRGIGSALLDFVLQHAIKHQLKKVFCHAQTSALDFYKRHGFNCYGSEFEDAGIPHQAMSIKL